MSILIKFKKKLDSTTTSLGTALSNLSGHMLKKGEPATIELSDGKQYLTVGSPSSDDNSPSDAKYVKLQSKDNVDSVLYKDSNGNIVDDTMNSSNPVLSFPVPINKGGTGTDSLTSKGVLVGNGTNAVSAVTGTNKALYFNNSSNPTAGILPENCGGTGAASLSNALLNILGISSIECDKYYGYYTSISLPEDGHYYIKDQNGNNISFKNKPKLLILSSNTYFYNASSKGVLTEPYIFIFGSSSGTGQNIKYHGYTNSCFKDSSYTVGHGKYYVYPYSIIASYSVQNKTIDLQVVDQSGEMASSSKPICAYNDASGGVKTEYNYFVVY